MLIQSLPLLLPLQLADKYNIPRAISACVESLMRRTLSLHDRAVLLSVQHLLHLPQWSSMVGHVLAGLLQSFIDFEGECREC